MAHGQSTFSDLRGAARDPSGLPLGQATGGTTVIGGFDEAAGILSAAIPTPEPGTAAIAALGLLLVLASKCAKSRRSA
jgi:hypothetical protein